jgi:hypothetical protein
VLNRHMSLRAAIAAMSLISSLLLAQVIAPGAAHARCDDVNDEITSTLIINGVIAVSEVPVTGTCNDNNFYQANFRSHYAGWRASVWTAGQSWTGFFGPYGTGWQHYQFSDAGGAIPGADVMHFCLDNGVTWYCGWGASYEISNGVNHGVTTGINFGY